MSISKPSILDQLRESAAACERNAAEQVERARRIRAAIALLEESPAAPGPVSVPAPPPTAPWPPPTIPATPWPPAPGIWPPLGPIWVGDPFPINPPGGSTIICGTTTLDGSRSLTLFAQAGIQVPVCAGAGIPPVSWAWSGDVDGAAWIPPGMPVFPRMGTIGGEHSLPPSDQRFGGPGSHP